MCGSYLAYISSKKEKHMLSKEILKFRNKNFRPAKPDRHAVGEAAGAYVKDYVQEPVTSVFQESTILNFYFFI